MADVRCCASLKRMLRPWPASTVRKSYSFSLATLRSCSSTLNQLKSAGKPFRQRGAANSLLAAATCQLQHSHNVGNRKLWQTRHT